MSSPTSSTPMPPADASSTPPTVSSGKRDLVRVLVAVVALVLVQLGISAFYWIPDARAEVAFAPTWDIVGLVLLVVAWSRLPARWRWADRSLGFGLTFLVIFIFVVAFGQGFLRREFGQELILVIDVKYISSLVKLLYDNEPLGRFGLSMALVLAGLAIAIAGPYHGIQHFRSFLAASRRRQVAFVAGAFVYLGVGAAIAGVHPPVAAEVANQLSLVWNLKDPLTRTARRLEEESAANRSLALPAGPQAQATRPPRIYLFIVESYGQALYTGAPAFAAFPGFLERQAAQLERAGYHVRSSYLRSPVFGSGSWMADATLLCGVQVNNQKRFASLFQSDVRCLPKILKEGGYRTVLAASNTQEHEPRFARTYAFDQFYFKPDFHYAGPRFGWSFMPDQFVIDFVHRAEVAPRPDQPLFLTLVLTTSHVPWSSVPPIVDWAQIGDGALFSRVQPTEFGNWMMSGAQYEAGYLASIEYSLETIASYLQRLPEGDRSLVLVLGDHQPRQPIGLRWKDRWWTPIHVLSRDADAVARFAQFGYEPGFVPPTPHGEPAGYERLLPELLAACGARPQ